ACENRPASARTFTARPARLFSAFMNSTTLAQESVFAYPRAHGLGRDPVNCAKSVNAVLWQIIPGQRPKLSKFHLLRKPHPSPSRLKSTARLVDLRDMHSARCAERSITGDFVQAIGGRID